MTRKFNGKVFGKNGMPVVGIRVPSWASFTRPIFHGIVEFIRNREQWRIQTLVDSTNEMAPMVIDENWNGDGLILFRHPPTKRRRSSAGASRSSTSAPNAARKVSPP